MYVFSACDRLWANLNILELAKVNLKVAGLYLLGNKVQTSDFEKSYNSVAPYYDEEWYSYLEGVTAEILNNISDLKPEFILDLGCGPGSSTEKIQEMFPEAHITGVDFSRQMLAFARIRLGEEKVLLVRDTMENTTKKFADGQFNLITCNWSLGYSQDKEIYKNLSRILSDDGYLLVLTNKQNTLKALQHAIKYTMHKHYKYIQKLPLHKFPPDKDFLMKKLGAYFEEVKYGEGSFSIDLTDKQHILDWVLKTGIMAGYEYILDFRNDYDVKRTFEEYIKTNHTELTHNYMWMLLKKK